MKAMIRIATRQRGQINAGRGLGSCSGSFEASYGVSYFIAIDSASAGTGEAVINWTLVDYDIRTSVKVGVAYGSDIKQVETILVEQVRSNSLAAQNPEPRVRFREFGDSSLNFELLCWARRPQDRGRLVHGLNTGIYDAFDEVGIEIPFPQRDVHLKHAQECKG